MDKFMRSAALLTFSLVFFGCASSPAPRDLFGESKSNLEQMAISGNIEAAFSLGEKYDFASGVRHDKYLAYYWYYYAAKRGHGYAQLRVANKYLTGAGVPKRFYEAYKWYYICSYNKESWKASSKCKNQVNTFLAPFYADAPEYKTRHMDDIEEEAKHWKPIASP